MVTVIRRLFLLCLFVLALTTTADAATLTVCASGCTYTDAQLQTALDAANPGDTILLEQNHTYPGEWILPNAKSCPAQDATCYITLKTGVTSSGALVPSSDFPNANVRITPAYAPKLAKLQQISNNVQTLRTTYPGETRTNCAAAPCITSWWTISQLEIMPNAYAGFSLVTLGTNQLAAFLPGSNAQDTLAKVPHHFLLDQVYVHGDAIKGMQNGLNLAANFITVQNSSFKDFKGVGQDTQAIGYANGPGNLTVINNDIEGAAENFIAGGADVRLTQTRTVTASTTTTVTLNSAPTDIAYNNRIACQVGGTAVGNWQHFDVTNVAGNVVTFTPAATSAPDIPGQCEWNIVPINGTIQKNYFTKPTDWKNPIVPTPQNVQVTTSPTGGTLAAATYDWRVVAKTTVGQTLVARSTASVEVPVTTTGTTSTATIKWTPVPNADYYEAYGRAAGGENYRLYLVGTDASCVAGTCQVTDTGAATTGACGSETSTGCTESVPITAGTVWQVKNLFELKYWDTMLIEGNVFDYNWAQAQAGRAIVFTVINGDFSRNNYTNIIANIIFRKNKVRHSASAMVISGNDATNGSTQHAHDFLIQNNTFEDLGDAWSNGAPTDRFITFATGAFPNYSPPDNVTLDHNTGFQTGGASTISINYATPFVPMKNFVVTNNMIPRLYFGGLVADTFAEGTSSWNAVQTGTSTWSKNLVADLNCNLYPSPSTNFCPTLSAWQGEFVDFTGGNYRLKTISPYHNAGLDGKDLGADIDAIEVFTNKALSGDNSGGAPPPQPSITTTSPLPVATQGQAHAVTFVATGGTPPYVWTTTAGTIPTSDTFTTAGILSGTPTVAGTFMFTVSLTDALGQHPSPKDFTITVQTAQFPEPRPAKFFPNDRKTLAGSPCVDGSLETILVGDICYDLSDNKLKTASTSSPPVTWTAVGATNPNTLLNGGNTFGAGITLGTTDAFGVDVATGGTSRAHFGSAGDFTFNTNGIDDLNLRGGLAFNTDTYSLGLSTSNGRKIYMETITGTLRAVMGFGDGGTSTEYVWGVSTSTDSGSTYNPALRVRQDGCLGLKNGILGCNSAPSVSGFGTSNAITASNGTFVFEINVGTSPASSGTITFPTAPNGWNCSGSDITTQDTSRFLLKQTGGTTTTAVLTNYNTAGTATAFVASDKLRVQCGAY